MKRVVATILLAVLCTISTTPAAHAEEKPAGAWHFEFTPYVFAAAISGDITMGPVKTQVEVPFSDLFDILDVGLMGVFAARKGRWIVGVDAIFIQLSTAKSGTVTGPFGGVTLEGALDVTTREQIYQPFVAYRLLDEGLTLDGYASARYVALDTDADIAITTAGIVFPGGATTLSSHDSWWEPAIGARVSVPLRPTLSANMLFDVGGFGVGSDLTVQWMVTARWAFADHFDAVAGYRLIDQDFKDDNFGWDMVTEGPVVGVGVNW